MPELQEQILALLKLHEKQINDLDLMIAACIEATGKDKVQAAQRLVIERIRKNALEEQKLPAITKKKARGR